MADDKTIHIKVDGGGDAIPPSSSNKAVDESLKNVKKLDEALHNFTFATEEFVAANPPKKPGRPPKDDDGDDLDGPEGTKAKSKFLAFLKNAQKISSALTGVNSRSTKTLAVLIRTTKLYQEQQAKAVKLQERNNEIQETLNETQEEAHDSSMDWVDAYKKNVKVTKEFNIPLASIGKSAGIFALAVATSAVAGKVLNHVIEKLQENVANFSASLNIQKAVQQTRLIQEQIKSAGKVGGELAGLESTRGDLAVQLQKLETNLIDLLSPFLKLTGALLEAILKIGNGVLTILNAIFNAIGSVVSIITEPLSYLPFVGKIFGFMKERSLVEDIEGVDQLTKRIETIFDPADVGLPGRANPQKKIDGSFL